MFYCCYDETAEAMKNLEEIIMLMGWMLYWSARSYTEQLKEDSSRMIEKGEMIDKLNYS